MGTARSPRSPSAGRPGTSAGPTSGGASRPRADASDYLVRGDDPALVDQSARLLIAQLLGNRDPALTLEEHGRAGVDELDIGALVDACTTPPFLLDRRVVVVRDAGRLTAADGGRLAAIVEAGHPGTVLVVVAGGTGAIPQVLAKAIAAVGAVVEVSVGSGRDRAQWVGERLREAPVRLDAAARARLIEHLGEDLGRLEGILETLRTAYGDRASLGVAELEPFLGTAGSVPPWELTDAIDSGAVGAALGALHRMMGPGGRAPAEILAILHRHFSAMLRLDGEGAASPEVAARLIGTRSTYVASKLLGQSRRLGGDLIAQAIAQIGGADLDLKGRTALPAEVVLEVLVARLSRLVRASTSAPRRAHARARTPGA